MSREEAHEICEALQEARGNADTRFVVISPPHLTDPIYVVELQCSERGVWESIAHLDGAKCAIILADIVRCSEV